MRHEPLRYQGPYPKVGRELLRADYVGTTLWADAVSVGVVFRHEANADDLLFLVVEQRDVVRLPKSPVGGVIQGQEAAGLEGKHGRFCTPGTLPLELHKAWH